jgi:hypothetical protein
MIKCRDNCSLRVFESFLSFWLLWVSWNALPSWGDMRWQFETRAYINYIISNSLTTVVGVSEERPRWCNQGNISDILWTHIKSEAKYAYSHLVSRVTIRESNAQQASLAMGAAAEKTVPAQRCHSSRSLWCQPVANPSHNIRRACPAFFLGEWSPSDTSELRENGELANKVRDLIYW